MMTFLNIIVILFLHCFRLQCEMKSHHGLMSWNFIPGLKSRCKQSLRRNFLRKWLIIFVKGSILYVWLGSECASVVFVIIFSLKSFLYSLICFFLFLVFNDDSNLRLFQLFRFSMKHIHLHYNWQQNLIKKFGDIFRSVPT